MARGENARKYGNHKEWWSRRAYSCLSIRDRGMKFWKRQVHKIERQEGKRSIKIQLNET